MNGIIQKVFDKYIDRTAPKTPPFDILSDIESKLIEEIKNYQLLCEKDNGRETLYVLKISLIGDTE